MIQSLLNQYKDIEQKIYDYFEFVEQWGIFPIENYTEYYWYVDGDTIHCSDVPFTIENVKSGNQLYTSRLIQGLMRKDDNSAAPVDTHCDGNIVFAIFDNTKELINPPEELIEAFDNW